MHVLPAVLCLTSRPFYAFAGAFPRTSSSPKALGQRHPFSFVVVSSPLKIVRPQKGSNDFFCPSGLLQIGSWHLDAKGCKWKRGGIWCDHGLLPALHQLPVGTEAPTHPRKLGVRFVFCWAKRGGVIYVVCCFSGPGV